MIDYKITMLTPTWDCRAPLSINHSEIRLEMETLPASHEKPTKELFAVVRSELTDHLRTVPFTSTSSIYLLNTISRPKNIRHSPILDGSELMVLERTAEDKYLAFCDPSNPVHFMKIRTTRGHLARAHLLEYNSRQSSSSPRPTDPLRELPSPMHGACSNTIRK
jgi:hypothetical protein